MQAACVQSEVLVRLYHPKPPRHAAIISRRSTYDSLPKQCQRFLFGLPKHNISYSSCLYWVHNLSFSMILFFGGRHVSRHCDNAGQFIVLFPGKCVCVFVAGLGFGTWEPILNTFFFGGGNEKFQDLMENHCPPKVQEFFTGNPRIPNSQTKNSVAFFSRDFTNYMINFR